MSQRLRTHIGPAEAVELKPADLRKATPGDRWPTDHDLFQKFHGEFGFTVDGVPTGAPRVDQCEECGGEVYVLNANLGPSSSVGTTAGTVGFLGGGDPRA